MNILTNSHNSLVYDFGSAAIKFGWGGNAQPLYVVPPYAASRTVDGDIHIHFREEWLQKEMSYIDVVPMFDQNGARAAKQDDNDIMSSFVDWTYALMLGDLDPGEYSVLYTQPTGLLNIPESFNEWRRSMAEIAFEFSNHPLVSFQHDSALACYAHIKHTGLVVDFGWTNIRVIPVIEGHPLRRSIAMHTAGGLQLSNILFDQMTSKGKNVRTFLDPKPADGFGTFYGHAGRNIVSSQSQLNFCRRGVLIDIIKNHLRFDLEEKRKQQKETILDYIYFMPGREPVDIQPEMEFLADILFEQTNETDSLQQLISKAILSSPEPYQDILWKTIIPCGGLSSLPGYITKLEQKITEIAPPSVSPFVVPPVCKEASGGHTIWVGGSIVASMDSFPSVCITSQEWSEFGDSILHRKCL